MPREKAVDLNVDYDRLCQLTAAPNELNHDIAVWIEDTATKAYQEVADRIKRGM